MFFLTLCLKGKTIQYKFYSPFIKRNLVYIAKFLSLQYLWKTTVYQMAREPSRNHGAHTREASLLIKKKDVYASDTRSLGIFLLSNNQSWLSVYQSMSWKTLKTSFKRKKFQNAWWGEEFQISGTWKLQENIWHWFGIDEIGNQCLFWCYTNIWSYWWQIEILKNDGGSKRLW